MKRSNIILFIVLGLLFIPGLGECLFHTKGESREAIVAVSMLDSGNWILPESYGADIPYKPPMLAWLISLCSLLLGGGHVSEFTSRLPSALSAVFLLIAAYRLLRTRLERSQAWFVTLITATSFEFFRAAITCRVDMLLTAAMVGAIYMIYRLRERPLNWLWAVLLLSVATLTKGPVGTLLPCLAMGIYFLLRGDNFFRTLLTLTALCLASFVLPALWYYGAWLQGGDEFLRLAMEENIGRLTGTMSYDSHVNPWYYNVFTIVTGMLPWTIFVLVGLCYKPVRQTIGKLRLDRGLPLMAWTVGLTVFVFYCLPESKRSVYLLPCYPFMAYGAGWVLMQMRETRFLRYAANVLAALGIIAPLLLIVASLSEAESLRLVAMPWWRWPLALIPVAMGLWWLITRKRSSNPLSGIGLMTYAMLLSFNAAFSPMVHNARSDREAALAVQKAAGEQELIYGLIPDAKLMRYYTVNYYLGDRMRHAESLEEIPSGALVVSEMAPEGVAADTLSSRSCDTRRQMVLFRAPTKPSDKVD